MKICKFKFSEKDSTDSSSETTFFAPFRKLETKRSSPIPTKYKIDRANYGKLVSRLQAYTE